MMNKVIHLQEHELLMQKGNPVGYDERYNHLELIQWDKPFENNQWGYYASFKIGAEWIDGDEALVVTAKRGMENIDFLKMFMTCFSSNAALDTLSQIYKIETEQPAIFAPALSGVVSPLIVVHFLGVVNRIQSLKKGYVKCQGNLKKVKGHVKVLKNERLNVATKRYDRVYCEYDEYSVNIPENQLLKKALVFSQTLIDRMNQNNDSFPRIRQMIAKALSKFDGVSDDVNVLSIKQVRMHKLFSEYSEAIRLAKLILKHFDYSIHEVAVEKNKVTPFVIDMSLLYEHYVYGLLLEAYHDKVAYQFKGKTGYPDFLYKSKTFNAILDTKYIPRYERTPVDTYVVRQLSGYSRELLILRHLGYENIEEASPTPSVPCVIIYPIEGKDISNPFKGRKLSDLCTKHIHHLSMFFRLGVPIPTIAP